MSFKFAENGLMEKTRTTRKKERLKRGIRKNLWELKGLAGMFLGWIKLSPRLFPGFEETIYTEKRGEGGWCKKRFCMAARWPLSGIVNLSYYWL